jgi:hypothetical protein
VMFGEPVIAFAKARGQISGYDIDKRK